MTPAECAGVNADSPAHPGSRSERAVRIFLEQYESAPSAVWSAPGRVNLIGEHTDYNDGFVLPCALPQRVTVALRPRTDTKLRLSTLGERDEAHTPSVSSVESTARPADWTAYPLGVAWALRNAGYPVSGADLLIAGDVPNGAGLSSSHALECAVALALLDGSGMPPGSALAPNTRELARIVQRVENDFVGAPTGLLDQTASLCCTADHALWYDVRTGDQEQIPFQPHHVGLELLLVDTRVKHSHSDSAYGQRRAGCERAAELLNVTALRDISSDELASVRHKLPEELHGLVQHVVTENERVRTAVHDLRAGNYRELGPLLTSSHHSLRDDYQVSCPELDLAVETAREHGAVGARMTGGGFGGSALALVPVEARDTIADEIISRFKQHDLAAPRLFSAIPSAGAGPDLSQIQ